LRQLPINFQDEVFEWINSELAITNSYHIADVVGDLFEFAGMYFMAHHWNRYLLSLVAQSYEVEYGREDLEAAIIWEQLQDFERMQCPQDHTADIWDCPVETAMIMMVTSEEERQRYIDGDLTPPEIVAPEGSPDPEHRICVVCNESCFNTEHTECMTCSEWAHVRCCMPVLADECQNCQLMRFHAAQRDIDEAEAARVSSEMQRVSDRQHPLLLSTGRSQATPMPIGVPGNELEARLLQASRAANIDYSEQVQHQMSAHSNQRAPTLLTNPNSGWIPPYSYDPRSTIGGPNAPAIFLHTEYAFDQQPYIRQEEDPPIFPEAMSAITGVPMIMPSQQDNRYFREITENFHHERVWRPDAPESSPIPRYSPWQDETSPPVAVTTPGIFENEHLAGQLEGIHHIMQANMLRRGKAKGKSKGKERAERPGKGKGQFENDFDLPQNAAESLRTAPNYHGLDAECTVCMASLIRGRIVVRIQCNHLFHKDCWKDYVERDVIVNGCPNCRAPPTVKKEFRYVGNSDAESARRSARTVFAARSSQTQALSNSSFESVTSTRAFMVSEVSEADKISQRTSSWAHLTFEEYFAEQQETMQNTQLAMPEETIDLRCSWEDVFLGETTIPGKSTMLVDLGSRVNVIGCSTEKVMSAAAGTFGHYTKYNKKGQALLIRGVGDGHARCDVEASIPIAVQFAEQSTTKEVFQANVATGSGADLPAILGADSMQKKDGVLCLREGKEFIAFPGPGGYAIQWSPGTKILPMKPAPSGHLVIECGHYDTLAPTGESETISFWTDHRQLSQGPQALSTLE